MLHKNIICCNLVSHVVFKQIKLENLGDINDSN